VLLALLGAAHARTEAAELRFGVDVGAGYSDNITLVRDNRKNETMGLLGGELYLQQKTRRTDTTISAQAEYLEYFDDTYDGELNAMLIGLGRYELIEDRLIWSVEDNLGQVKRSPEAANTPDNRELVNYFTTGPDLIIPLTRRIHFALGGRYSNVYYEDSDAGSDRTREDAALVLSLSEATRVSVHGVAEQVSYDDETVNEDYDREEVYIRYALHGGRTSLSMDAGYTQVEGDTFKSDSFLGRIEARRQLSESASLRVEIGRDMSDAANSLRQLQGIIPDDVHPVQEAGPFVNTYGTVAWEWSRRRTTISLVASYFDEEYEREDFDRTRLVGSLVFVRHLSNKSSLRFDTSYSNQEFDLTGHEFGDFRGSLTLDQRLGRRTHLSIQFVRYERLDDIRANEYSENQAWIRFGYRSSEPR
jgi:hypothetical protein